jgi:ADP-ribosylglycohydrolase
LEASDFEDAVRNAVSLGGDADTLAAVAGALGEALFGLPREMTRFAEEHYLDEAPDIRDAMRGLYRAAPAAGKKAAKKTAAASAKKRG